MSGASRKIAGATGQPTTTTRPVPSATVPWLPTPASLVTWLPPGKMAATDLVIAQSFGPRDPIDQSPTSVAFNPTMVGPGTEAWMAAVLPAGAPYPSEDFTLNWLFWPSEDLIPSVLAPTPSGVDEDGLLFLWSEEWDTEVDINFRFYSVAWTPGSGFTFYGWVAHDWVADYGVNPNYFGPNVSVEYFPDEYFPRTNGTAGVGFNDTLSGDGINVPSVVVYEVANAGDATIAATSNVIPEGNTAPWIQNNPSSGTLEVRKDNGNYVIFHVYFDANLGQEYWEAIEYTASGVLVSSTPLLSYPVAGSASGGVSNLQPAYGPIGSGLIYLPVGSAPGVVKMMVVDYETMTEILPGWAFIPAGTGFFGQDWWAISSSRVVGRSVTFASGHETLHIGYYDSDGTSDELGAISLDASTFYSAGGPTPDGTHFMLLAEHQGATNATTVYNFYLVDLAAIPTTLPAPLLTVPFESTYSLSTDTIGREVLGTLLPTTVSPLSQRFNAPWNSKAMRAIIKGSPNNGTRIQSPPAPSSSDNSQWQNARVISGNVGTISDSFTHVPSSSLAGFGFSFTDPALWYRFDPQGRRGFLFWWLSTETNQPGWKFLSPNDPFVNSVPEGLSSSGDSLVQGGQTLTGHAQVGISTDSGLTWNISAPGPAAPGNSWHSAVQANGVVVMLSTTVTGHSVVAYTEDGISWSQAFVPDPTTLVYAGLASLVVSGKGPSATLWAFGNATSAGAAVYSILASSLVVGGSWSPVNLFQMTASVRPLCNDMHSVGDWVVLHGEYLSGGFYVPIIATSSSGGAFWNTLSFPPTEPGGFVRLVPSPSGSTVPRLLYFGNALGTGGGGFYTDDMFTWIPMNVHFTTGWYRSGSSTIPHQDFLGPTLWALSSTGVVYSPDSGASWYVFSSQPMFDVGSLNIFADGLWSSPNSIANIGERVVVTNGSLPIVDQVIAYQTPGAGVARGSATARPGEQRLRRLPALAHALS